MLWEGLKAVIEGTPLDKKIMTPEEEKYQAAKEVLKAGEKKSGNKAKQQ